MLSVVNIGSHLPPDQPFYAVQPRGIEDDRPPHTTVEQMAADHLAEIRSVQPVGPYALGGHCSGSWVAFEMARQLQAVGEHVDPLVLVDIGPPGAGPPPRSRWRHLVARLQHYRSSARAIDALKWRLGFVWELGVLRFVGRGRIRGAARVRNSHWRAHQRFVASPIEGGALLVRSEEYDGLEDRRWHLEWHRFLSGPPRRRSRRRDTCRARREPQRGGTGRSDRASARELGSIGRVGRVV